MHEELNNLKNNKTPKVSNYGFKKVKAPLTSITYDRDEIDSTTENIYEAISLFQNVQNR